MIWREKNKVSIWVYLTYSDLTRNKNTVMIYLQTNLPVFRVKESSVRRRYSDFEWLRNELERDSKVNFLYF